MKNKNVMLKLQLFLFFLFVTSFELINTSSCVYQNFLSGKERVGSIGNFKLNQWVLLAIFPLNGFFGIAGGAAKKSIAITHVFENYKPIRIGVDPFFHNSLI